jgi:hypothetical protein
MFAGAATNAYVGNAFFPDRLATTGSAVKFATSSLATALAASVYTEFSPEVGRALGALVKRGRTPATRTTVPGGHQ